MQFRSFRLTFGTEIVILYIAEECVRLRPIPPAAGYFLYYARDQAQGYAPIIHKKIMLGILYVVFYWLCIHYRYMKCWYFNDCTVITIPIIYIMGSVATYIYRPCIVNQVCRLGLHLLYCNLYDVVNLLAKSGWQLSAACQSVLSVYWPVCADTVCVVFCCLSYWYIVLSIY